MESFSAEWLALREPIDHASRAHDLAAQLAARLAGGPRTRALDLASGTGSNVRYLMPRLPHITHWTLVDHDATLLDIARRSLDGPARRAGVTIETLHADLRALDAVPFEGSALVTASALLDLVSASWLDGVAGRCRAAGALALFALTYDGRIACEPPDPWDAHVRDLVNRHQRTDKGFGPALGPDATEAATRAFAGWHLRAADSDWSLDHRDADLQRRLVEGWAAAACAVAPAEAEAIEAWHHRRIARVDAGASRIRVGHQDVMASPPPQPSNDAAGPRLTSVGALRRTW